MKPLFICFIILAPIIFSTTIYAQQDINDPRFEAALNLHKQGAFDLSTTQFRLEMDTAEQKDDWAAYFEIRNWISKNYWKQELLDSAQEFTEITLREIAPKLGAQSLIESQTYSELGVIYDKRRDYENALEAYKKCLNIRKASLEKGATELGQVYFNIGTCYTLQDRHEQAIEYYEKAKFVFEQNLPPNHLNRGWLYQNLGASNAIIEDYKVSLMYWKKALAIYLENYGPNNPRVAIAYDGMAGVITTKGFMEDLSPSEIQLAIDWYDKSFSILKELVNEDHFYIINMYIGKGALLLRMGKKAEGFALLKKAERILLQTGGENRSELAVCYVNLTLGKYKANDYQEAMEYAHKGILVTCSNYKDTAIFSCPSMEDLFYTSSNQLLLALEYKQKSLAELYKATKNPKYKKALKEHSEFEEALSNRLLREFRSINDQENIALKQSYNFDRNAIYYFEDKDYEQLLYFAETSKSIFLKRALEFSNAKELGGVPDSLKAKEVALKKRLADQQAQLVKMTNNSLKDSLKNEIKKQLLADKHHLDDFIADLEQSYPQYYQLKYKNKTYSIEDIQEQLLDEESLLLEYFITDEGIYALGISKKEVQVKRIVAIKAFNQYLVDLKKILSNLSYVNEHSSEAWVKYTESAYGLYELLVADFVSDPQLKKLIIVPDMALGKIPFETFLTKKVTASAAKDYKTLDYLIKDYSIYYSYSASLLLNKATVKPKNTGAILGMAASYNPKQQLYETKDPIQLKLRKALQDLPGAKKEVETLEMNYEGTYFFGEAANEHNFKKVDFSKYSIVHLAMHGIMNKKDPMFSSLVFTEKNDTLEDDFLYAYEFTNLQIPSELMVLSACETGDGSLSETEGVMSLARSCLYAGTPSILMTLWQVNDYSTSLIISSFYDNLSKGMSKSEALRQAKLTFLDRASGLASHPNLWAALVNLGDDSPIAVKKKGAGAKYWYGIGGLLLCLILGFAVFRKKK